MVSSKRYMPTNKRFQDHTKQFVGTKSKKGHLNKEDEDKQKTQVTTGYLKRVLIKKMDSDGWEVSVGKGKSAKTYMCSYGDNIVYLPKDCVKTDLYYIPKHECEVELNLDLKTKIYTIQKLKDPNKVPITMMNGEVTLQGSGDSSLTVSNDAIQATGILTSDEDVVVQKDDNEISLVKVDEKITNIQTDGLTTEGDVVAKDKDNQEVSLVQINNDFKDLRKIGIQTEGDIVLKKPKPDNKEKHDEISLFDLYQRVLDLEEKVNKLNGE